MAYYFTPETDEALIAFNASSSTEEKHKLFEEKIRPAFEKLIENLIYVYHFYTIDDVETLKGECLTNLYETIVKFDPSKGAKGFSYFNVVAKNWFIHKIRERAKQNKSESELYYDLDHESVKNDPNFMIAPHEEVVEDLEKWMQFYSAMDSWKEQLSKASERKVLDAVIFLMKNPDLVTIYNKKAVYLYLRELTGLNTKQVVVNLKKIKELYDEWHEEYLSTGESIA
jgi:hypothetical protein